MQLKAEEKKPAEKFFTEMRINYGNIYFVVNNIQRPYEARR